MKSCRFRFGTGSEEFLQHEGGPCTSLQNADFWSSRAPVQPHLPPSSACSSGLTLGEAPPAPPRCSARAAARLPAENAATSAADHPAGGVPASGTSKNSSSSSPSSAACVPEQMGYIRSQAQLGTQLATLRAKRNPAQGLLRAAARQILSYCYLLPSTLDQPEHRRRRSRYLSLSLRRLRRGGPRTCTAAALARAAPGPPAPAAGGEAPAGGANCEDAGSAAGCEAPGGAAGGRRGGPRAGEGGAQRRDARWYSGRTGSSFRGAASVTCSRRSIGSCERRGRA